MSKEQKIQTSTNLNKQNIIETSSQLVTQDKEASISLVETSKNAIETNLEKNKTAPIPHVETSVSTIPLSEKEVISIQDSKSISQKVSRSRSRSKEKIGRIVSETVKEDQGISKEFEKELSKEDKLRLAKERYLQRKKGGD